MLGWLAVAALVAVFAASASVDPRTFRTGVVLFAALGLAVLLLLGDVLSLVQRYDATTAAWLLLSVLLVGLLTVAVLGVLLVLAGLLVLRRERRTPANLLALVLGLLLLGYVATLVVAVAGRANTMLAVLVLIGLPATYLGAGLCVLIGYGLLYQVLARWRRRPAEAVVVLGAGLRGHRVTPQLANRLDRGRAVRDRLVAAGRSPVIVTSGGQGPDEAVPEAQAMRSYLVGHGVPADAVLMEDRSRNTRENLAFSRAVLAERGITGPVVVATSNYHALRAAMLMRRLGIEGRAVGSRIALYYWPNAVVREYLAILRDHLWTNVAALALLTVPLVLFGVRLLNG